MGITLEQAEKAIMAAKAKATEINTLMNIAIVDAGANLVVFARMDKARTARYFDMPSGEIGKLSQPGGSLYNIEFSNGGLISFPGGIPIKDEGGTIIGAIGVSGSTVENDHTVAQAGVDALS